MTLKDANSNAITGLADQISGSATNGASVGAFTETSTAGVYEASLTSDTAGETVVTITVGDTPIDDKPSVTFVTWTASATATTVEASPSSDVSIESPVTITVTAIDTEGNPIQGEAGSVSATASNGAQVGAFAETATNSGVYQASLTSTSVGTTQVTVRIGNVEIDQKPSVTFVAGAVSAAETSVTADPASGLSVDEQSTITVVAKDAGGNTIAGLADKITGAASNGAVVGDFTESGSEPGTYTATLTSTKSGQIVVTITIDGTKISTTATVTFGAGGPDPSQSTLTTSETSILAGGDATATLTVQVKDANGNNVTLGGDQVVFDTTAGTVTEAVDRDNGTYTATLTSSEDEGTATISATVNGSAIANTVQVAFVTVQAQPEDSGALVSSIATSSVMSAQLGSLVSDAAIGGLSSGAGPAGTAPSPSGGSAASGDEAVASLDTSAYSRLHVFSAREGDQMPLVDWFSMGLSNASVDAELKGDGDFGYAVVGTELDKNETSVSGLLYGAEASSWNYEGETDVDRAGVSIGYYSARREGGLIYTGSSILTASRNEFESVSDATGNAASLRLILKGEISGQHDLEDGSRLTPFVDLLYSTETLESFKFSDGVSSDQAEASLGRLGLGVEYMTMPIEDIGRITLRGELSQVFGAEDVTLNDGTVYSPNEDPVGAISVGWIGNNDDGSTTRIDLTFGELGNGENEEIRIDGTWDRRF